MRVLAGVWPKPRSKASPGSGMRKRKYKDGREWTTFPDGRQRTVFPDGRVDVEFSDGSRKVTPPRWRCRVNGCGGKRAGHPSRWKDLSDVRRRQPGGAADRRTDRATFQDRNAADDFSGRHGEDAICGRHRARQTQTTEPWKCPSPRARAKRGMPTAESQRSPATGIG